MNSKILISILSISILIIACQNKLKEQERDLSQYEMINGCKKETSRKSFRNGNQDWIQWNKKYVINELQTCDFSQYIRFEQSFKKGILREEREFISGCDECEEKPCGIWKYYDEEGKEIKSVNYGDCKT